MTGYARVDSVNNIADGNIINASDLDGEFDGVAAAFNSSTGHIHDGSAANGAPITKVGPAQDVVVSATTMLPKTTATVDIGSSSLKFKDFFFSGAGSVTGTITAGGFAGPINGTVGATTASTGAFTTLSASSTTTLSGLTASTALALDASKNVVSVTNTGTGSNVLATSPTLVTPALGTPSSGVVTNLTGTASININGTVGATTPAAGTFTTLSSTGNTTIGDAVADTITVNGQFVTGTVLRSAQTATNTLALAAYDTDGVAYTNLITLTASTTPTLTLVSTGVGTINNMSVGATTASTGAFTTLTSNGATTFTAGTASTTTGTGTLVITGGLGVSGRINAANFDGIVGANTAAAGTFTTLSSTGNTTLGDAVADTITVNGQFVTGTVLRSAQTATNTLALAAYDVDGAAYTNLVTLTASNTPTLALTSTGVGSIDNMTVGATTASTGAFTTFSATGTATFSGNVSNTSSSFTRTATTQAWLDGSMTTATWIVGGTTQTGAITLGRSTVSQAINIGTGATTAVSTKAIIIGSTGVSGSTTTITSGSSVSGALVTHTWNAGANNMTFDTGGSLGIGSATNNVFDVTSVARPLLVQRSDSSTNLNASTAAIAIVNGDTTTNNTAQLNFAAITGASSSQYSSAVIACTFGARTNAQYPTGILTFSTSTTLNVAPTEKMRITSAGNVGIGTSSPTQKVSIAGGLSFNSAMSFSGSGYEIGQDGADFLCFSAGSSGTRFINASTATEFMRIDTSGNVGIGTSSAQSRLHVYTGASGVTPNAESKLTVENSATAAISILAPAANESIIYFGSPTSAVDGGIVYNHPSRNMIFRTAGNTERMRLDTAGRLMIGGSTATASESKLEIKGPANTGLSIYMLKTSQVEVNMGFGGGGDSNFYINSGSSTIGTSGVFLPNVGTSWSSVSDERMKTIVGPIENASAKVATLRTVIGYFNNDTTQTRHPFLIAQDVQAVLPEAVNVQNLETGTLGMSYTDTIPLLVAAIKEQQTLITSLTSRIAALESN